MKCLALVAALLAGCIDPEILPPGVSCELTSQIGEGGAIQELDLVIVVSDAEAMAPYQDAVLAHLAEFGDFLVAGNMSLHVALVDAGGLTMGDGCNPASTDPFLANIARPWWACPADWPCHVPNFDGPMADILPCAAPAQDVLRSQALIQNATNAITRDDTGFMRPNAFLGIVVISAEDDASPQPVGVYVDRLRSTPTHPGYIWVSTINGTGTTRLAEFRNAFTDPTTVQIDNADWNPAIYAAIARESLVAYCLPEEIVDLDPEMPGKQGECVATDDGAPLPYCRMAAPDLPDPDVMPCYWMHYYPDWFPGQGCSEVRVEREHWQYDGALIRCSCAM